MTDVLLFLAGYIMGAPLGLYLGSKAADWTIARQERKRQERWHD